MYILRLLLFENNFYSPDTILLDQLGDPSIPHSFDPSTWQPVADRSLCVPTGQHSEILFKNKTTKQQQQIPLHTQNHVIAWVCPTFNLQDPNNKTKESMLKLHLHYEILVGRWKWDL